MHDYYLFPRFPARKPRSHFSKSTPNTEEEDSVNRGLSKNARLTSSNVPKDAAVHFGNFYGVQESSNKPQPGRIKGSLEPVPQPVRIAPRLEFTRQMVHKLERTAGTDEYARQVSALLEETVEPPHFRLHSVPPENSIPDGRQNPTGYPLWYKEPYKIPFSSDEIYKKLLSEKYDNAKGGKDVFDEELSDNNSSEESTEEEQIDDFFQDPTENNLVKKVKSMLNALTSASTSATEAKDTDDTSSDSRSEKISFHCE
ncbi:PREDICTED: uncharacterized protein LOC107191835 [Dufourea novaeangliae]|uniref:Uncharacterized protein n=1 Tax=Dufourea novaeangliae TaxID=178035 RepID=A0A154PPA6_DUFNO|nr:PREDICTED: uncharacterized protein LOC107191835 [Dufourea novaeangliae]KZC13725.1 hypothetical protein WN55_06014 [Dufourea novaeangliae]